MTQKDNIRQRQYQLLDLSKLCIHIGKHNNFTYVVETVFNSKQNIDQKQDQYHYQQQYQQEKKNKQLLRIENNNQNQHHKKQQLQQHQQLMVIKFDLIQHQPLTTLIKQCNLFTLHCGTDLTIQANLKLSKLFDLQSVNYYTQIQTAITYKDKPIAIKGQTIVNTQQKQFNQLRHNVEMQFVCCCCCCSGQQQHKQPTMISDQTSVTLIVGDDCIKYPFGIEKFIAYTESINRIDKDNAINLYQQSMQKPIIKNLSIANDYSYPLIDRLQLLQPQLNPIDKLRQCINQLQEYEAPLLLEQLSNNKQLLYICHDMKGGYVQDVNTYQPIRDINNNNKNHLNLDDNKNHSYRFNYLSHTKIFNYFSHYPITIPPYAWRTLCKRYNTLCLGTFIVQPNQYVMDQSDFVTEQFALKLIYIAKRVGFDGYLVNIEVPVKNVERLTNWLQFLTKQINTIIPNSQIIWYDSIIYPTGQINYQNQLNQSNLPFYLSTNGIFTNYWWSQTSLVNSMKYKHKDKPIYVGNDCWGRNTYGGGRYDLYKAVNKIQAVNQQLKSLSKSQQLSIALFAPGYTYEDNAQSSIQTFTQNQLKMYHGHHVTNKPITKWKVTLNQGQGWKQQQQWAVTSYQLCKRQALIDIKDYTAKQQLLTVTFSCIITGTGPNFADYYKITLQLFDYKNNMVYHQVTYPKTIATEKQQRVQIEMEIDTEIITDGMCLRLLQEGKDAQFWAGHFGTRFKQQTISFSTQNKTKNWIITIDIQHVNLNKPYITFFNKGQGSSFYYFGKERKQQYYDSLCDYDFPPVYTLNDPSCLQVQYKDAYVGGSCLRFRETNKIIVNRFKAKQFDQQKQRIFNVRLTVKGTEMVSMLYGKYDKDKKQLKSISNNKLMNSGDNNNNDYGWRSYQFQLIIQEKDSQFQIQCKFSTDSGLIGYMGVFQTNNNKLIENEKDKQLSYRLIIKSSNKAKHIFPYCVDVLITSYMFQNKTQENIMPQRLLLKIGQFIGFMNIDKNKQSIESIESIEQQQCYSLTGYLKNIPILNHKYKQFQIQLININQQQFNNNTVLKQTISLEQLKKLTENNKCLNYQFTI